MSYGEALASFGGSLFRHGPIMNKYLTEFIGTFFLVLTICLTVFQIEPMAPLAIGCSLMIMVYMGGHVSGAHYNPAVSLAVLIRGKLEVVDFVAYVLAQVAGATAAAYVSYAITGSTFAPKPNETLTTVSVLLVEILYTFALALVVLNVATSKKTEGNSYYGLAIGFTIVVAAFAGGKISGGAFNPAVGTGPTIINAIVHALTDADKLENIWSYFTNLWIYLVGPFIGGAAAALVFKVQEGIS